MSRNPTDDNTALWSATLNAFASRQAGLAILSGCTVSKGSGDFDSDISSGTVWLNGSRVSVSSTTVTHTDTSNLASGNTRVDLITADSGGSVSITEGTGATDPTAPDIPADEVLLGYWQIAGDDSTLSSSDLFDLPDLAIEIEDLTSAGAAGDVAVTQSDGSLSMDQGEGSLINADELRGNDTYELQAHPFGYAAGTIVQSNTFNANNTNPFDVTFNDDGTKMYDIDNADVFNEYTLSTAFDTTSASFNQQESTVSDSPSALALNDDGTKLYETQSVSVNGDNLFSYDLSTAFDISSKSSSPDRRIDFSFNNGIAWSNDGTKLFATDGGGTIAEFTASTAYDITTLTKDTEISSQATTPKGIAFASNGQRMLIVDEDTGNEALEQWEVPLPFDLDHATHVESQTLADIDGGIATNLDGSKLFGADAGGGDIIELDVGLAMTGGLARPPRLSSDPANPADGTIWYRSDNNRYRGVEDGTVVKFDTTDA